ncbi:L,D-transpeptidase family protein [Sphingomonas xanthus]|uniref:L,D-transpeptidase family protein n=1 Tax=Sphingomonas xanthus TaxID=2594473 RepID=A0A516IPX4_9SPHN|nr:L,D-transpeptidase family protein [Sphingomonas xanthus]QDP18975.1 L,D-transpeptidase family protein [Sphingomonas xanthus]
MANRTVFGWSCKPAGCSARPAGFAFLAAASLATGLPAPAKAAPAAPLEERSSAEGPAWFGWGDDAAALALIEQLETAGLDGLDPSRFDLPGLKRAVRDAGNGKMSAVSRASKALDRALVRYVNALRAQPPRGWTINDRDAVAQAPSADRLLADAASAPDLAEWVRAMPWMHSSYASLRRALADADTRGDTRAAALLRLNLDRARMLPGGGRYVLVNTAAQRLYMVDDGKVIDQMRVVVGKKEQPTPQMAATIKFTALNPYWNVPPDLTAERIAPHVLKQGPAYLRQLGYVVLSDWSDQAVAVDPATIDWQGVANGRIQIRVRQDPGPHNSMGRMKFMFPNPQGIYLHDTPNKELLNEDARLFSGGCVRLEDASRLARWLHGRDLEVPTAEAEQPVALDRPIPVYLVYQTAVPSGGDVVFHDDIYGEDAAQLAALAEPRWAAR